MPDWHHKRIYDFGMHKGEDTRYYLKRGFSVVAIEADPAKCESIGASLLDEVKAGSLTVINTAIGNITGKFTFYICNEEGSRSTASESMMQFWRKKGETFRRIEVEYSSAIDIIASHGDPYYVKIDIEGHDLICLQQLARAPVRPQYVSFEVDFGSFRACLDLCRTMGYRRFCLVDQKTIEGRTLPADSKEGRPIPYRFSLGQTGPFGDDLPGPWRGHAAVLARCTAIATQHKLVAGLRRLAPTSSIKRAVQRFGATRLPDTQAWFDIHARR